MTTRLSQLTHRLLPLCAAVLVACGAAPGLDGGSGGGMGGGTGGGAAGGGTGGGMASDAGTDAGSLAQYPPWQLQDVQPQSNRFGQTYGLNQFQGQVVVVVLLQGF